MFISSFISAEGISEIIEYAGEAIVIFGIYLEGKADSDAEKHTEYSGGVGFGVDTGERYPMLEKAHDDARRKATKRATLIVILGLIVGLGGIINTNRLSDEKIAELNRKANQFEDDAAHAHREISESNAKAEQAKKEAESERLARLELEKGLSDRSLTIKQVDDLLEKTKGFPGQRIDIFLVDGSFDAFTLAMELEGPLFWASWQPREWSIQSGGFALGGIEVFFSGADKQTRDAATAICSVLNEQPGLSVFNAPAGPITGGPMAGGELRDVRPAFSFMRQTWSDSDGANIWIVIWPKRNPVFSGSDDRTFAFTKALQDANAAAQVLLRNQKIAATQPKPNPQPNRFRTRR